ncbi:uncharacterized protein THITE_2052421, partial [Thermothielavioides terrestris NRRL 8126]
YNLNNTLIVTIGRSLNELVYSFKLRSILDILHCKKGTVASVEAISAIAKIYYNDKYTPTEFEVGDTWAGPFKIIYKIDRNAYKLNFLASWKVYLVVLVS